MKRLSKFSGILVLGVVPMALALPAEAGGRGGIGYGYGYHSGFDRGHGSIIIRKSFRSGYHGRSHYRPRHHRRGGSGTGEVLLGFGLGFLLGHAVTDMNQPRERVVVRERPIPVRNPGTDWYQPPQQRAQRPPAPEGTCLQSREYTTTVTIGGEPADAYGTACLQPDGSWRFGPPQPVPR